MQITDDLGRTITVDYPPQRIISLVPSLTELLFDLGLEDRIVGVTKFCIHPKKARRMAKKIGGTKKFDFDLIAQLKPDLIVANKEENYKEGVEELMKTHSVYVSDIFTLEDSLRTIRIIGSMTGSVPVAQQIIENIQECFNGVKNRFGGKVLYFIWQSPDMVVASDNFIDYLINWLGLENIAGGMTRYPQLTEAELCEYSPDYVLLSSEPYPFKEKHLDRFQKLFPMAEIILVDGEMFSWYGSRLQEAPAYFKNLPLSRRR